MSNEFSKTLRTAAKGSGWSVKQDTLSRRIGAYALDIHPRRGSVGCIEFRAKPAEWDYLLWSILHIKGNEKAPVSFHFWGAFTCDTPALIQQDIAADETDERKADQMVRLAAHVAQRADIWEGYDLGRAISNETPQQAYRYHMTRVVERICHNDRETAHEICDAALKGELDLRGFFSSTDDLAPLDDTGHRPFLSFFQLAQIWISRN
ncbi:MAG: hypothetical protein Q4G36_09160 [Paracoccus sp. (in: a-proteobacteria)]|nr:hypothetical protein [Paracoccus sp. (in: a-proteobacteria)]